MISGSWKTAAVAGVALAGYAALLTGGQLHREPNLRLNQIQVIGTHNSYHAGIAPSESELWRQKNPQGFAGLDYRHAPLDTTARCRRAADRARHLCRQQRAGATRIPPARGWWRRLTCRPIRCSIPAA